MKKSITITVIVMALLVLAVSCSAEERTGYVTFGDVSRDVFATIGYPDAQTLTWTVTATKISGGSRVGEGTYENVLLTDSIGPFSIGRWTFTFDGGVYHGETTARISEGANSVAVTVSPAGDTGTLEFGNCNIPQNSDTFLFYVVDGEKKVSFAVERLEARADGNLGVEDRCITLGAGLHEVEITLEGNDPRTLEHFTVRIEPGITTTVSFGTFEGRPVFTVTVNEQEALAE